MEAILKYVTMAWNPSEEVQSRLDKNTLNIGSVAGTFLLIVIACNLFTLGATQYFLDAVIHYTNHTRNNDLLELAKNKSFVQYITVFNVIIPILFVTILPSSIFEPYGKNKVASSIFIIIASWSFYNAIIGSAPYFIAGFSANNNNPTFMDLFEMLSILTSFAILILTIVFWVKVLKGALKLQRRSIFAISFLYLVGLSAVSYIFSQIL